jgi:hypothetical protein
MERLNISTGSAAEIRQDGICGIVEHKMIKQAAKKQERFTVERGPQLANPAAD